MFLIELFSTKVGGRQLSKTPVYSVKVWSHQAIKQWGGSSAQPWVGGAQVDTPKNIPERETCDKMFLWLKFPLTEVETLCRNCQSNHFFFGKEIRTS